jgi:predicted nucleic-acid-binding protein
LIAIDTNVLVRYVVQDHPQQSRVANQLLESLKPRQETCFITNITLCELVWVLESCYDHRKSKICELLEKILQIDIFVFENKDLLLGCLKEYRDHPGDFADYLIGKQSRANGANQVYTFDKKLKSSSAFKILS